MSNIQLQGMEERFSSKTGNGSESSKTESPMTIRKVTISSIFYVQLFHLKVFHIAFWCLRLRFVFFWQKEFGAKAAHKMLVKLTIGDRMWKKSWIPAGHRQSTADDPSAQGASHPGFQGCYIFTAHFPKKS